MHDKLLYDPVPPEPKREDFPCWRTHNDALSAWLKECVRISDAQLKRMTAKMGFN